jgi:formylglycine-generating enzyme required for sulfatase activity
LLTSPFFPDDPMTPPAETFRYDAFLSYRRKEPDRGFARSLLARLESEGLKLAIDERDFSPEATFLEEMERCICESRFTLTLLSPRYFESGNTTEEAVLCKVLDMAERRRRLIPLVLEPVERPGWLYNITGIDFTDPQPLVDPFEKLLAALRNSGQGEEARPAPEPSFPDDATRDLGAALEECYRREEELLSTSGDTTAVRRKILDLKRQLREGGRLKAGDYLAEGRFRLIELLGRGGFATVWKAVDRREHGLIAVKVLHGQHADDRSRRERFFRGARKMAELHHQGIVRVVEKRLGEGGFHFFVMEYLPGGDLREAVLGKRLAPEAVLPLLQEVAVALQFAHEHGVFHRDVKPANVLLDAEGRPKLTDFDLVRAADTTGGTTLGGAMLGTFLYTAPEVMSEPQEAGVAADVYSLAMTAAFCLHGADLHVEVLRDAASFLSKLPCAVGVQAVLRKAAAWVPGQRFTSVAEFAAALKEGLSAVQVATARKRLLAGERPQVKDEAKALNALLEKQVAALPEAERPTAVLRAVEEALPIAPEDLTTIGLVAWALDYFPGRSKVLGDRAAAGVLREGSLAALRERCPAPPCPGPSDPDWAAIPGGSFMMGTPTGQPGGGAERPPHPVALSPFRLLVHPVTNREYDRLLAGYSGAADLPAIDVDWYSAYAYAAWLGGRLPTEAEWEYAARAGCTHPYCDRAGTATTLFRVGWYDGNSGGRLHPVQELEPNPWGLYDMYGDVWEWVSDWCGTYQKEAQADPWGPPSGAGRVVRGGCYWDLGVEARAAFRSFGLPGLATGTAGSGGPAFGGRRAVAVTSGTAAARKRTLGHDLMYLEASN